MRSPPSRPGSAGDALFGLPSVLAFLGLRNAAQPLQATIRIENIFLVVVPQTTDWERQKVKEARRSSSCRCSTVCACVEALG